jgi:hypothetical protein
MIGTNLAITTKNYAVAGSAVVYDTDAQAYFTANSAITNTADKNAINTFYLGIKSDGIYTKIKAMYLPIWGSAAACKWNLVNALDTDAAFRATFTTGWTYASTGITPNGTSAYMDCKIKSSDLGLTQSMGFYSGTNNTTVSADIGAYSASEYTYIFTNSGATTHDFRIEDSGLTRLTGAMRTDGFICSGRKNTTSTQGYRQGTEIITAVTGLSTLGIKANVIGALNGPSGIALYSNRQIRFGYFSSGTISATEMTNFHTRVQTLMTYFGINV